ncbi:HlyD family efflux transporter periplasmic adaptor subunit [Fuchsiella alkaliacetigena]|uniref:HlyD family efflux transporter periplasmic adaptor subunit n=1 Tax=Fuchsiella alkaliacetigena TaxID=957042 RepID=UPI00200A04F4|nr:HlyD family efflux transporter periplasmic adaptor subunit [Fuchsiella alkaliacetigena]MCK8823697.1 hypothetical protein [Fuchsiella alkaliacetigena]
MKDYKQDKDFLRRENNKSTVNKSGLRITKKVFRLFFIILILVFLVNLFIYNPEEVVMTEYGQVREEYQTTALFVRDETVKYAPTSGKLNLKVEAGQRVRPGTLIVQLEGRGEDYRLYSYQSGLVSYQLDGLESTLTLSNLESLTYQKFQELSYKFKQVEEEEVVNSGRPIFKVVNNFELYLVAAIPKAKVDLFNLGAGIKLELLNFEGHNSLARVERIISSEPKSLVVFKVRSFLPLFTKLRKAEVNLISSTYNGIVVPTSALIKQDDRLGVVLLEGNTPEFKEVRVLKVGENKAVVQGIEFGLKVSTNPSGKVE